MCHVMPFPVFFLGIHLFPVILYTHFLAVEKPLTFLRALKAGEPIAVHMVVTHHPKAPY
jgi:hypothetical protein